MSYEQMIAWLTLEGWEPYGQRTGWWVPHLRKPGVHAVYYVQDPEGKVVDGKDNNPIYRYPPGDWEDINILVLLQMYRHIIEKGL